MAYIILYVLSLVVVFSLAYVLRKSLDCFSEDKNSRYQDSLEILDNVQSRNENCDIDQAIRGLEAEEMDISPRYIF